MSDIRDYKAPKKSRIVSEDSIYDIHAHDINLKTNEIFLFGIQDYIAGVGSEDSAEPGIEYVIANRFLRNMHLCMRSNPGKPLLIHMKTNGGYWEEGMAIYDAIKAYPSPVTILSYTHARSMSSLILLAANKRVLMPNSYFMFHDGTMAIDGTTKQVESGVEFGKAATTIMMDIYVKAMKDQGIMFNKSDKQIFNWLRGEMDKKEDVYIPAKQAVELGFADEIFDANWERLTEDYTELQLSR